LNEVDKISRTTKIKQILKVFVLFFLALAIFNPNILPEKIRDAIGTKEAYAAQFARPSGDINLSSPTWTDESLSTTNIYNSIDETEALLSDSDYVQSSANQVNYYEASLSSVTDPESSSDHVIRWRVQRTKTNKSLTIVVRLFQGTTEIASQSLNNTQIDTFTTSTYTLSTTQADAITDYSNLRYRFDVIVNGGGGQQAQISWAELEVPNPPPATINISGTIYTGEGSSALDCTSSRTVALSVAGAIPSTVECSGSGSYSFSGVSANEGDVLTLFLDGESEKAATVTVAGTSNMTAIDLYQNHIVASGSITIASMSAGYNQGDDPDIPFTATDSTTDTLVASSGFELFIPLGYNFKPEGNIDIQDLKIAGTYTATGTEIASLSGNFTNNGTFASANSTFVFASASKESTVSGSASGNEVAGFYNFTSTEPGKTIYFKADSSTSFAGVLTLKGASGNPIYVRSTIGDSQWLLNLSGSSNVNYLKLKDSGCYTGTNSVTMSYRDRDAGFNDTACWKILSLAGGGNTATDGDSGGGTPQTGGVESGGGDEGTDGISGGGTSETGGGDSGGDTTPSPTIIFPFLSFLKTLSRWIFGFPNAL